MLALREAHEPGATRVSINGQHVLTGGQDGVVTLFPVKRWPEGKPLWARQCHTAAVTFVTLLDDLHIAFSCGRDGHVFLHENVHDSAGASTSRLICRVTGEVRCMHFDTARTRLFLGGDSLRCLKMSGSRFDVQMVPLIVPYPVAAVAVSPCGRLLAMASTQGSIGVVSVVDGGDSGSSGGSGGNEEEPAAHTASSPVRLVLDKVTLSAMAGKEDQCTFRMQWCRTAGGLFLLVPTSTAVAVMRLVEANDATETTRMMKNVGMLYGDGLTDLFSVCAYPVSSHRLCCVMASRSGGLYVGKLDDSKFRMSRHTSQRYEQGEHGTLADVQVNEATGDIVVGLSTGRVSLLHRAALKAYDEAKEASRKARREEKQQQQQQQQRGDVGAFSGASERILGVETQEESAGAEEAKAIRGERATAKAKTKTKAKKGRSGGGDDDFINDEESISGSSDEGTSSASSSSSSSLDDSSRSDSDSDTDEGDGTLKVRENLQKVVVDLKANNADYIDDDDVERPSRWRDGDPRKALAEAERETRRRKEHASRFLDDEAEEASSTDVESEDAAAYEEDGYGERRRRRDTNPNANGEDDEEDEAEEGFYGGDSASATGTAPGGALSPHSNNNADGAAASVPVALDYSFQVGATPSGEEGSCYLAYNSTGFIRCTRESTTVHFHDVSIPGVRINEKGTIIMGALSPIGAGFVIAPPSSIDGNAVVHGESIDEAEEDPRLVIYYRTFVALGAQSDWRARLQPGETVRCMAAGGRFLAVATSRYLRLYSLSGLELAVLSKFPRIVTMAGTSSRKLLSGYKANFDPLAVVYLEGGEHKVEVMDVGTRSCGIPAQVLPLTGMADGSSHQLQWLGWSEDGPLHTADTAGVVRMFTQSWGGAWVPVFDPRALSDQSCNLWIWGVNDECLHAYRSSKTDPAYPAAVASGLPVERVPLFLPLTRTSATATGGASDRETVAWDHVLRREIRADELKRHSSFYSAAIAKHDAVHDAKIKELFQGALRVQQTSRAVDLAMLLELRDSLEDCARDANSGGHTQLVQKLLTLYDMRLKAKQRRKCELPLEKAMVSEKERDELLRRLLARERNANKSASTSNREAEATAAAREIEPQARALSPAKSEATATTAVTATTDRSPPPKPQQQQWTATTTAATTASTASRRVTFNIPDDAPPRTSAPPATARALSLSSASSAASSAIAPAKPSNPFAAKKTATSVPTPAASAASTAPASKAKTQTTLAAKPARTTFATTLPAPVADVIGVDSQSQSQTQTQPPPPPPPPPTTIAVGGADSAVAAERTPERLPDVSRRPATVEEGEVEEEGASSCENRNTSAHPHHSSSLSPSGGRVTGTTPSSEERPHPAKKPTFIPKALATRDTDSHAPSASFSAPVDPFLTESTSSESPTGYHGTGSSDGGGGEAMSVAALLDAGHEDSLSTAPRSSDFGEALRKRYRDDDDDEDSNGVMVPATSFARVQ